MTDRRDYAHTERWWNAIDEGRMMARVDWDYGGKDDWVPITLEVCNSCDGRGRYVNPNIDRNGISSEEFYEDPEFEEMYMGGGFDVTCDECQGMRVSPRFAGDHKTGQQIEKMIAERHAHMAEIEAEQRMLYGVNY
jgi:hypothetical protein